MNAIIFQIFPIVLPFVFLAFFLGRLRHRQPSPARLLFYLFSGLAGIFVMLIPGLIAVWQSAVEPSFAVWFSLMTFCFFGMGLAMGTAYLIMHYLWLDE